MQEPMETVLKERLIVVSENGMVMVLPEYIFTPPILLRTIEAVSQVVVSRKQGGLTAPPDFSPLHLL